MKIRLLWITEVIGFVVTLLLFGGFATPKSSQPHIPKVDSREGRLIVSAMCKVIGTKQKQKVVVRAGAYANLKVQDGWAWFDGEVSNSVGKRYLVAGLLRKTKGQWRVLHSGFDDEPIIQTIRKRYPQAPRGIFPNIGSSHKN
jgi:hypothetical protein